MHYTLNASKTDVRRAKKYTTHSIPLCFDSLGNKFNQMKESFQKMRISYEPNARSHINESFCSEDKKNVRLCVFGLHFINIKKVFYHFVIAVISILPF